jgi:AraC-like DNA-binding protein
MAETRHKFGTGVVNLLLAHKRTLREVLLAAAEYRHLLNEALAVYVEDAGATVTIREELVVAPGTPTNQAIELALGVLARHSSALLGSHWKPRTVHFTHAGPADLTYHRRFFGCPKGRVAALLGYNQQGSFTNWFTSRFGMTPRDWRSSRRR